MPRGVRTAPGTCYHSPAMVSRIAYLLRSGRSIPPFGDPVGETLVLDRPLRDLQAEALAACGFAARFLGRGELPARADGETLVLDDDLFFTPEFLRAFLEASRGRPAARPLVRRGLFTRQIAILQDLPENEAGILYPLHRFESGALDAARAVAVPVEADQFSESGGFPPHMIGREEYRFGLTARALLALRHAIHIPLANMAANLARLARFRSLSPLGKLRTLARSRSLGKARLLAALSTVDPSAEVHPTAVVEGSVVRAGAKIGAYAVVRHSVIGERAFVDDHAGVKFSVVGSGAYVANNCVLFFTTVYPRAFLISGPYQFSCFGRDSAIMNSIPSDYRLDGGTVKVATDSGVRDTGLRFAGSVIGHRTRIAAGLILAPGRAIPNDLELYPDPRRVLSRIDASLPPGGGRFFLVDGKLVAAP